MKKYLLFMGYWYYPSAMMGDYYGDFDTISEAVQVFNSKKDYRSDGYEWACVVEHSSMKVVREIEGD